MLVGFHLLCLALTFDTWFLNISNMTFQLWYCNSFWRKRFEPIVTVVLFRYVRLISDCGPHADEVIESWSGFGRMLTHHTSPLMSSATPFVCGPPLYLWQAFHFLLQAGRVFAAWWFQGFRALCPYSTPLFDSVDRKNGGGLQTGRRREGD